MPNKKKSFREIAALCGISVSTVSRLANGITESTGEKTEHVLALLREEGYEIKTPIRRSELKNISLIVADLSNEIFNRITITLSQLLAEQSYTLSIYIAHGNAEALLDTCIARKDAAVIFMGLVPCDFQKDSPIPVIHIMAGLDVSYRGECYRILSDDYVGGQLAARKMLSQNRRHPLILNIRHAVSHSNIRIDGFLEEYRKAGIEIPPSDIYPADPSKSSYSDALDAVSYLWTKGVDYDSIYATSDWRAYGAISALRNMNVSLNDVMVVGYDGTKISRYGTHPYPSVQQNPELIATTAVRLLLDLIGGTLPEQQVWFIPVQMSRV